MWLTNIWAFVGLWLGRVFLIVFFARCAPLLISFAWRGLWRGQLPTRVSLYPLWLAFASPFAYWLGSRANTFWAQALLLLFVVLTIHLARIGIWRFRTAQGGFWKKTWKFACYTDLKWPKTEEQKPVEPTTISSALKRPG